MAHDVRLFQMAEFGIGGARNTDLVIHLLDDVKQGDSEYAKRAIELMFYGKDDRRFSDPWEIMLNELKGQICDNPDQFEQFYELIRLNGSAELVRKLNNIVRGCALVEMPVGGAQREEGSEYDYEYLSSEEEPEAENIATESDMGVAQRLAREEEEELAVRLMQEEEDRRLAEQFEREEMGAFVVPVASRSDESGDRQMAEALEERLRQEELDRQIAEALERGDDISDLF